MDASLKAYHCQFAYLFTIQTDKNPYEKNLSHLSCQRNDGIWTADRHPSRFPKIDAKRNPVDESVYEVDFESPPAMYI